MVKLSTPLIICDRTKGEKTAEERRIETRAIFSTFRIYDRKLIFDTWPSVGRSIPGSILNVQAQQIRGLRDNTYTIITDRQHSNSVPVTMGTVGNPK